MNCSVCQSPDSFVVRTDQVEGQIKRRRQCARCGHRWTTYEAPANVVEELDRLKAALRPVAELVKADAQ